MTEQAGANVVGRLDQVAGRTNQNNINIVKRHLLCMIGVQMNLEELLHMLRVAC
jgi:hypothetical protein